RIECYDVSNIQGEAVVGSMVVFQDAVAKKAHYRKFGVRSLDGQDDYAALGEVISRRFARLGDATSEEYDESFAATPNLVVIDGGKGQLDHNQVRRGRERLVEPGCDRWGQGPARGRTAGDAGVRPAASWPLPPSIT